MSSCSRTSTTRRSTGSWSTPRACGWSPPPPPYSCRPSRRSRPRASTWSPPRAASSSTTVGPSNRGYWTGQRRSEAFDDVVDAGGEGLDVGRVDGREHADAQLVAAQLAGRRGGHVALGPQGPFDPGRVEVVLLIGCADPPGSGERGRLRRAGVR